MSRVLFLLAILLLLFPVPVQAQSPVTVTTLNIDIWPEYDQPGVLVIYHATLAPSVRLPAEVVLRVPAAAGGPSAVAEQNADGLFTVNFREVSRDTEWLTIAFSVAFPQFQMEFYDPSLAREGNLRSYDFRWPGDLGVDNLNINVQQPRTATALALQPSSGTPNTGADGLTYLSVPVGAVKPGDTFTLTLSYQKDNEELTRSEPFQQVTPVLPANQTLNTPTLPEAAPWIMGGIGILLIVLAIAWYLHTANKPAPPSRARPAGEKPGPARFCHQCGEPAGEGDVFCRSCGTKLRK